MSDNKHSQETKLIQFLGGRNLLFTLVSMVLLALLALLFPHISYIFNPIVLLITSIITPMFLAVIFYYIFVPLVDLLEKHKLSRGIGALISLIILIVVFIVGIGLIIPTIINQIISFSQALPALITNFVNILQKYSASPEFQIYYSQVIEWINNSLTSIAQQVFSTLSSTINGITSVLSAISGVILALMTFPIFLIFLLIDGRQFKNQFLSVFPKKLREDFDNISHDINAQVGAYIKGRLLVSFIIGIYYYVIYSIIGLDYAFVLALLSGLLSLIPYLGSIISLVPTLIVALTKSPITIAIVLAVWVFAQILDGNILGPSIIGRNLKMHPLTVMIVLIGSGAIGGVIGMVIGIPVYAALRIIIAYLFNRFKNRYIRYFNNNSDDY